MLLKTNSISCSENLIKATNFIERLIEFAYLEADKEFDEGSFLGHFVVEGKWILDLCKKSDGSLTKLGVGINGLFSCEKDDRKKMLDAFSNDIQYSSKINDEKYKFEIPLLKPARLRRTLKEFLVPFYEEVLCSKGGFVLFGSDCKTVIKYSDIIKGYFDNNTDFIKVCPACLEMIECKNVDNKLFYKQLDHYFPKSRYPALVLFPDNLTPICITCNEGTKGKKDPIDIHGDGCLSRVYIPYHRHGVDDIRIVFDGDGEHRKLRIISKNSSIPMVSTRISNYIRLFNLEERWESKMEGIYEIFDNKYREVVYTEQELEEESFFKQTKNIADIAKSFSVRYIDKYLIESYSEWIISNNERAKITRLSMISSRKVFEKCINI